MFTSLFPLSEGKIPCEINVLCRERTCLVQLLLEILSFLSFFLSLTTWAVRDIRLVSVVFFFRNRFVLI